MFLSIIFGRMTFFKSLDCRLKVYNVINNYLMNNDYKIERQIGSKSKTSNIFLCSIY